VLDRGEIEIFCNEAGYEARFVPAGFLPRSDEERMLIAPPERNMDVSQWQEQLAADVANTAETSPPLGDPELEAFRRRLEGLL
jgi:hypothetical protein